MRIFGVILAGGLGRRMGGADKALVELDGKPLLSHVIERAAPQVEQMALSANGDAQRFSRFGLAVLPDDQPLGPLAGILSALWWAKERGATAVASFAVDTPFFPADLVPRLCLAAEAVNSGVAIAVTVREHPTFGIWPVGTADALAGFLASGAKPRLTDFADALGCGRAWFAEEAAFRNINTPADLDAAAAALRGAG